MKIKPVKATKSLPEMHIPPNPKKRRQTVKRTVHFSSTKTTNRLDKDFSTQGFQIRDEDFSTIFSDLPSDEKLIIGKYDRLNYLFYSSLIFRFSLYLAKGCLYAWSNVSFRKLSLFLYLFFQMGRKCKLIKLLILKKIFDFI